MCPQAFFKIFFICLFERQLHRVKLIFSRNYVLYGAFYYFLCTSFTRQPVLGPSFLDSNRSDNPVKHTVHDKILDKVIETGKGQKVKAKQLKQTCLPVQDVQVNIYIILPQENVRFCGMCKFCQRNQMVHKSRNVYSRQQ